MAVDTIEKAIYSILSGGSTGSNAGIYPGIIPQDASLPAVVYQQISGPREHSLDGPNGLVGARYQITSWAESYSSARSTADLVRGDLDGVTSGTGTVVIQGIDLIDEGDMPELGTMRGLHRYGKRHDYMVWFEE